VDGSHTFASAPALLRSHLTACSSSVSGTPKALSLSLWVCLSVSLSLSLSLFLFLRFWACWHGLQNIACLFFITLISFFFVFFFFFVMDIFLESTSLGVTNKSVFQLPHMDGMGRRRRGFDPLMGHSNRCVSVCLCVCLSVCQLSHRWHWKKIYSLLATTKSVCELSLCLSHTPWEEDLIPLENLQC